MCVSRPWFTWSTCPPDPRLALRLKKQETYCGTLRYLYTVSDGYAVALQLYGYNFVCVCTGWKRIGKRSTNKTSIMWMVDESECKINSSYFWGPAYCHPRDICSKYHNATVVSSTASVTHSHTVDPQSLGWTFCSFHLTFSGPACQADGPTCTLMVVISSLHQCPLNKHPTTQICALYGSWHAHTNLLVMYPAGLSLGGPPTTC